MLQDTMHAVKETEDKASQMIADAVAAGEELLQKTETDIKDSKADVKQQAKKYDEEVMGKVKNEEERLISEAMDKAKGQIEQIQKLVVEKETEAINMIIGEIV